jgi:putative transposase
VHVVNRGVEKRRLFDRPRDYDEFLLFVDQAQQRVPTRVLAYVLMPNHWHFVLWPVCREDLSRFLHYVTSRHAARFRQCSWTTGLGHVYQNRYRLSVVDGDVRYVRTLRYVEANPLRANLVRCAEDWPWSSLAERLGSGSRLSAGPVALPPAEQWAALVNRPDGT